MSCFGLPLLMDPMDIDSFAPAALPDDQVMFDIADAFHSLEHKRISPSVKSLLNNRTIEWFGHEEDAFVLVYSMDGELIRSSASIDKKAVIKLFSLRYLLHNNPDGAFVWVACVVNHQRAIAAGGGQEGVLSVETVAALYNRVEEDRENGTGRVDEGKWLPASVNVDQCREDLLGDISRAKTYWSHHFGVNGED